MKYRHMHSPLLRLLAIAVALAGCAQGQDTTFQPWMSSDVQGAWNAGYKGQGTSITVVDDFAGRAFSGNLTGSVQTRTHGDWTALQSGLVAPEAEVRRVDYFAAASSGYALRDGLNVINNSYAVESKTAINLGAFDPLERTTINHAKNGTAVVVKAAGNEAVTVTEAAPSGNLDALNLALVGAPTNIYVGALTKNGTPSDPAAMASYSNFAGNNRAVQNNFLVVGVDTGQTGLSGTSFAAPIVSGYAAILGSKFRGASPSQITNQLLGTARTDTIQGYSADRHGKGEASLSRALAPASLQ